MAQMARSLPSRHQVDHGHHSGGDHEYVRRASPITPSRHIVHQVEATLAERYASMAYAFASAIPHMSLVGAKATTGVEAGGRRSEVNPRQYSTRRPPQFRGIGRCFPTWCDRGEVGLHAGCLSSYKFGQPSCGASSACRKMLTLSRCFEPSDAPAGHIGGLKYEDLHEVGWGRDIANL